MMWKYKEQHPPNDPQEPTTSLAPRKQGCGLKKKPMSKVRDLTTGYLGSVFPGSTLAQINKLSWNRSVSVKCSPFNKLVFFESRLFPSLSTMEGFLLEDTVPKAFK